MTKSIQWNIDTTTVESSKNLVGKKLCHAVSTGEIVEIEYSKPGQECLKRSIQPKRLFKKRGSDLIYVDAFCDLRNDYRVFELSWIKLVA